MTIDRNAAKLLAEMFDRDYPTDQRGIGNLGRAYLEAIGKTTLFNPAAEIERAMEMAAWGDSEPKPRSMWWWISPRALWREWRE